MLVEEIDHTQTDHQHWNVYEWALENVCALRNSRVGMMVIDFALFPWILKFTSYAKATYSNAILCKDLAVDIVFCTFLLHGKSAEKKSR